MKEIKITTIDEIKERTAPAVVELPGFGDGKPFVAKVKRASLLDMALGGSIPNELLGAVTELYKSGINPSKGIKETAKALEYYAQCVLVEPSYQAIKEADLQLTDMQLTRIYLYGVGGAEALKPFR